MTNLFSIFDPATYLIKSPWLFIAFVPLVIPTISWNGVTATHVFIGNVNSVLTNEINIAFNNNLNSNSVMALSLFYFIAGVNCIALLPHVFPPTSHISVTLPLSVIIWATSFIYSWANNTENTLAHLLPQGTPNALISFIVLIELTSNVIRPLTLCIRLTANLIAGHLLITLLGNFMITLPTQTSTLLLIVPATLTVLESAVALIQSYVFITLCTLYIAEATYDK